MAAFNQAVARAATAVENLCAVLVAAMVVLIISDVVGRNVFDTSIAAVAEITTLLQIYIVFLAGSVAVHRGLHFTIVNTRSLYGEVVHERTRIIVCLSIAAFSSVLGFAGFRLAGAQMEQLSPSLQMPYGYFYLSLPLGCVLSTAFSMAGLFAKQGVAQPGAGDVQDPAGSVTL